MTEETKPKVSHKSKNDSKDESQAPKLTPVELAHQYKLTLANDCKTFGKDYKETQAYFHDQGFTLSKSQFVALRKELKSTKRAKNWFSKEALFAMEDDHMLSVERIRNVEDKIVRQIDRLLKEDDFETKVTYNTKGDGIVKMRVRDYNTELLIKLTSQFESLQTTKTKMFAATPLVQEIMEVHRRHEEDDKILARPAKPAVKEKEIKA